MSANGVSKDGSTTTGGGAGAARGRAAQSAPAATRRVGTASVPDQARQGGDGARETSAVADIGAASQTMAGAAVAANAATTTLPAPGRPSRRAEAAAPDGPGGDVFARYARDYVADRFGQPIAILHAGCATAFHDLGADQLREDGADIFVTLIDDDGPPSRAAVAARPSLREAILGDLRSVPLPPRSTDIVHCALLLDRIHHAELVLDRLVSAIKPGGLLLLRIRDRDSAAGVIDRMAPGALRRLVWRARRPGQPGPFPAVHERLSSARGVQSYVLLRGLVVAERQTLGGTGGGLAHGPRGFLMAQRLLAWLSRGRLTAAHEELLYVLRKPENRFARLI